MIAWLVDGKSTREVVALLAEQGVKTTFQGVAAFRKRHLPDIDALTSRVVAAVEDLTIRDKAERIRRLSGLYDGMQAIVDTRGLLATDVKFVGGPEYGREVEVERFDAALVKELRGVLSDVADELGDRPKTPLIDARTLNISLDALAEIKRRALSAGN